MPQNTHYHFTVVLFNLAIIITLFQYPLASGETIPPHELLRMRQTLKDCRFDIECPENAYCSNGRTCLCIDGYLVSSNRTELQCLKVARNMGESCREDVQCRVTFTIQAECRDNVCVCSEGSHYVEDERRCYQSVGIGGMCHTSHNCHLEGPLRSFCVDGSCTCPILHHPTAGNKSCLRDAELGERCTINESCVTKNARCFGKCGCKVDYVLSEKKKECLKAANAIGDPCDEDSQCRAFLKNAKCGDKKKCTCVSDFKRGGSVCLRRINLDMMGKMCSTRAQCVKPMPEADLDPEEVVNVDCLDGICSCAQHYTFLEDKMDCVRYGGINAGVQQTMATFLLPILIVSRLLGIV